MDIYCATSEYFVFTESKKCEEEEDAYFFVGDYDIACDNMHCFMWEVFHRSSYIVVCYYLLIKKKGGV